MKDAQKIALELPEVVMEAERNKEVLRSLKAKLNEVAVALQIEPIPVSMDIDQSEAQS